MPLPRISKRPTDSRRCSATPMWCRRACQLPLQRPSLELFRRPTPYSLTRSSGSSMILRLGLPHHGRHRILLPPTREVLLVVVLQQGSSIGNEGRLQKLGQRRQQHGPLPRHLDLRFAERMRRKHFAVHLTEKRWRMCSSKPAVTSAANTSSSSSRPNHQHQLRRHPLLVQALTSQQLFAISAT